MGKAETPTPMISRTFLALAFLAATILTVTPAIAEESPAEEQEAEEQPAEEQERTVFDEDFSAKEPLTFDQERARMLSYCRSRMDLPECAEWKIVQHAEKARRNSRDCTASPFSDRCIAEKNKKLDQLYKSDRLCNDLEKHPTRAKACRKRQGELFGW